MTSTEASENDASGVKASLNVLQPPAHLLCEKSTADLLNVSLNRTSKTLSWLQNRYNKEGGSLGSRALAKPSAPVAAPASATPAGELDANSSKSLSGTSAATGDLKFASVFGSSNFSSTGNLKPPSVFGDPTPGGLPKPACNDAPEPASVSGSSSLQQSSDHEPRESVVGKPSPRLLFEAAQTALHSARCSTESVSPAPAVRPHPADHDQAVKMPMLSSDAALVAGFSGTADPASSQCLEEQAFAELSAAQASAGGLGAESELFRPADIDRENLSASTNVFGKTAFSLLPDDIGMQATGVQMTTSHRRADCPVVLFGESQRTEDSTVDASVASNAPAAPLQLPGILAGNLGRSCGDSQPGSGSGPCSPMLNTPTPRTLGYSASAVLLETGNCDQQIHSQLPMDTVGELSLPPLARSTEAENHELVRKGEATSEVLQCAISKEFAAPCEIQSCLNEEREFVSDCPDLMTLGRIPRDVLELPSPGANLAAQGPVKLENSRPSLENRFDFNKADIGLGGVIESTAAGPTKTSDLVRDLVDANVSGKSKSDPSLEERLSSTAPEQQAEWAKTLELLGIAPLSETPVGTQQLPSFDTWPDDPERLHDLQKPYDPPDTACAQANHEVDSFDVPLPVGRADIEFDGNTGSEHLQALKGCDQSDERTGQITLGADASEKLPFSNLLCSTGLSIGIDKETYQDHVSRPDNTSIMESISAAPHAAATSELLCSVQPERAAMEFQNPAEGRRVDGECRTQNWIPHREPAGMDHAGEVDELAEHRASPIPEPESSCLHKVEAGASRGGLQAAPSVEDLRPGRSVDGECRIPQRELPRTDHGNDVYELAESKAAPISEPELPCLHEVAPSVEHLLPGPDGTVRDPVQEVEAWKAEAMRDLLDSTTRTISLLEMRYSASSPTTHNTVMRQAMSQSMAEDMAVDVKTAPLEVGDFPKDVASTAADNLDDSLPPNFGALRPSGASGQGVLNSVLGVDDQFSRIPGRSSNGSDVPSQRSRGTEETRTSNQKVDASHIRTTPTMESLMTSLSNLHEQLNTTFEPPEVILDPGQLPSPKSSDAHTKFSNTAPQGLPTPGPPTPRSTMVVVPPSEEKVGAVCRMPRAKMRQQRRRTYAPAT